MVSVSDVMKIGEFIASTLRVIPPTVGLSLVRYDEDRNADHLRIINTGPTTIHGFHLFVHDKLSDKKMEIRRFSRRARDIFGRDVTYHIEVPERGLYLRPDSAMYVLLRDIANHQVCDDLSASFSYEKADGGMVESDCLPVVHVVACVG